MIRHIKSLLRYPLGFYMRSNGKNIITLDIRKAIAILLTAVLGSAGASIWGTLSIANTVPFRVDALEKQVEDIKVKYMPLDLSMEKWKNNETSHTEINSRLNRIEIKLDEVIKDLNK